ncbi:methyltransferase [Methanobrevibacter arboriphilus JCM 13429 = DSM 1125]|uniref:Methyltransferase n=1 Tax=Methanobrevibacter arboriphilus JCM 13429 = DSM 1125 TaxID=1300164 RepID=A0A1V6N3U2_METAZ|nr:class I SAM-dependent methyltransferase [Methanobrevibacter arboriphilus]OQD59253.1 methyltransferase [Methanobrevibacter arboriphilus JCM 13429 = DSM 1125]
MANEDVCSYKRAGFFDSKIRKLFQNPNKILSPYINKGMNVLDLGCGPGFFTLEMANLVGESGKVVAADLQEEMLIKVENKTKNNHLKEIIKLHKTQKDSIGLSEKFDFILIFYMLHEVPNKRKFLGELKNLLKNEGKILIIEPKGHVSKENFEKSVRLIKEKGFKTSKGPKVFYSYSIALEKITN